MINSAREAAYLALLESLQEGAYLSDIFDRWRPTLNLDGRDLRLMEELALGTMRRLYTLDAYAVQLSAHKRLSLKLKEKILLRLALYQYLFLEKVPLYAIGQEMTTLAKKYTHPRFVAFLSALIRQFDKVSFAEPKELWQRVSAPPFLIDEFRRSFSEVQIEEFFEIFNRAPLPLMRHRTGGIGTFIPFEKEKLTSPDYYVQNPTPALLMNHLSQKGPQVGSLLDLCAAPGGKLLLAHDLYPHALLSANDPSAKRLERMKENLVKYGIEATLSCLSGEVYPLERQFDLIILDVPCSNSGVLHKRAEARYRIGEESCQELAKTQFDLIAHAAKLLAAEGQIWYMTCSILRRENEEMVQRACQELNLDVVGEMRLQLPTKEGADGGFAAALRRKR